MFFDGWTKWLRSLNSNAAARGRRTKPHRRSYRPQLEVLEDLTLPSITLAGIPNLIEQGPSGINFGLAEGIEPSPAHPLGVNPVAGAIEAIAADPVNANRVFVGTVNGGVWRTLNATATSPNWTPLTDQFNNLSIGAIALSPLDANHVFAGLGKVSSFAFVGGRAAGVLRSLDGGNTWVLRGQATFAGLDVRSVVPTRIMTPKGQLILAAAAGGGSGGIFRSDDGGEIWQRVPTGFGGSGLPVRDPSHLVADPGDPDRFYAAFPGGGVFRSDNTEAKNWDSVNFGLNGFGGTSRIEVSVHNSAAGNVIYAALMTADPAPNDREIRLSGIFRSEDQGSKWTAMDLPGTIEQVIPDPRRLFDGIDDDNNGFIDNPGELTSVFFGLHPSGQASRHFAMLADRDDPHVIFVGGDAQPSFTAGVVGPINASGTSSIFISGRLFRGDASRFKGEQWTPLVGIAADPDNYVGAPIMVPGGPNGPIPLPQVNGPLPGTAPHADSRDMVFDANGNILQCDDGGIYRLVNPHDTVPTDPPPAFIDPPPFTFDPPPITIDPPAFQFDPPPVQLTPPPFAGLQAPPFTFDPPPFSVDPPPFTVDPAPIVFDAPPFIIDPTSWVVDPPPFDYDPPPASFDPPPFTFDPPALNVTPPPFAGLQAPPFGYDPPPLNFDPPPLNADPPPIRVDPPPFVIDPSIYQLKRHWVSVNGNLRPTEFVSIAYDARNNIIIGGTQDNGALEQPAPGAATWNTDRVAFDQLRQVGDGNTQAVDALGANVVRYAMTNNFGGFVRREYNNNNNQPIGPAALVLLASPSSPSMAYSGLDDADKPVIFRNGEIVAGGFGGFEVVPYAVNAVAPDRLLLGRTQLYESFDQGDTLTTISRGSSNSTFTAVAYGGRQNFVNNPNVMYAGTGNSVTLRGSILVRTFGPTLSGGNYRGKAPLDIVLDPDDFRRAYAIDLANVYQTTDGGANWVNITGNLTEDRDGDGSLDSNEDANGNGIFESSEDRDGDGWFDVDEDTNGNRKLDTLTGDFRTLELFTPTVNPGDDVLLVGTAGGLFRTILTGATNPVWNKFGANLPNAVVSDVHYDRADDLLLVGTLGRGVWTIPNARSALMAESVLTINGDTLSRAQDDVVRLVLDANNPLLLNVFDNNITATPSLTVPLASLSRIVVNGLNGGDTLIVDGSNGMPIPGQGIAFDGGRQTRLGDSLIITGAGTESASFTQEDPRAGQGKVQMGEHVVSFLGAEGITAARLAALTEMTPFSADVLSIESLAPGQNRVSGKSAGNRLIPLTFFDVKSFTLDTATKDGATPDDTITIQLSGLVASGLRRFTAQTGAGADRLDVLSDFSMAGVPSSLLGGDLPSFKFEGGAGNDTIAADLDADFVLVDGSLSSRGGIIELVDLDCENADLRGSTGDNRFTVFEWTGTADINGGGGNDTLSVLGSGVTDIVTVAHPAVTMNSAIIRYQRIATLEVDASAGPDVIRVTATGAGLNTTIKGGDGNDNIRVTLGAFSGALLPIYGHTIFNLTVNGGDGVSDRLTFDDRADPNPDPYTLAGNTFQTRDSSSLTGRLTDVFYFGLENVQLDLGNGGSTVTVTGTDPIAQTTLNAGGGNDAVNVAWGRSTSPPPFDFLYSHTIFNFTVNGEGGTDSLNLNDRGDPNDDPYTIRPTSVEARNRFNSDISTITYATLENLTLDAGSGGSTFRIEGTALGTATTVRAGLGNDRIDVINNLTDGLSSLQGPLFIHGEEHLLADRLNVTGPGARPGERYGIASSMITRADIAPIIFQTVEGVKVDGQNVFIVTSTADTTDATLGDGLAMDAAGRATLRAALQEANTLIGSDLILFKIAGASVQTIQPFTPLPIITDAVVIDGYSQPGASPNTLAVGTNAVLQIEIDGTNAGEAARGLVLQGGASTLRGLVINRFGDGGIFVQSSGHTIAGNYIGTDPSGTLARPNADSGIPEQAGISIRNSSNNIIGGNTPADRNVISGNHTFGIRFDQGGNSAANEVLGNYIGLNAAGTGALANALSGIYIFNASGTTVGSDTAAGRNVISANGLGGVLLGGTSRSNRIAGNYIGTDATGTLDVGNALAGIHIEQNAGSTIIAGNLISGNDGPGVNVVSTVAANVVAGNLIGTDATGTFDLGNAGSGVRIRGSGNTIRNNLISGNDGDGVSIAGPSGSAGLVGWWRAEDNADGASGGNHGALVGGTTFTAGKVGHAFGFDGVDDYVDIPHDPSLFSLTQGTIEMWVRVLDLGANTARLFAVSDAGEVPIASDQWSIDYRTSGPSQGSIEVALINNGGIVSAAFTPDNTITDTLFHHLAVVADGLGVIEVYVDGVSQPLTFPLGIPTDSFFGHAEDADNMKIGAVERDIVAAEGAKIIDEVAIYNRPLSAAEIQAIVAVGNAGSAGKGGNRIFGNQIGTDATGAFLLGNGGDGVRIEGSSGNVIGGAEVGEGNRIAGNGRDGVSVLGTVPAGTVSLWRGDGTATDSVGANHGMLVNGSAYGPGVVGQAFRLDGVNDWVEFPDSTSLTPSSFTLDAWVNPDDLRGQTIVSKYDSAHNNGLSWVLHALTDGRVEFFVAESFDFSSPVFRAVTTAAPALTAGVWQHVAASFELATQQLRIYVNGAEVATTLNAASATLTSVADSATPVRIGCLFASGSITGPTGFWQGSIDEVGVTGRALSPAEVQAIVAAGAVGRQLAVGNSVRGNAIYANGGLGIDLNDDGPTPSNPAGDFGGANRGQNAPTLLSATTIDLATVLVGVFQGRANSAFTLDFYAQPAPGAGAVQRYLGSITVTTDANGTAHFTVFFAALSFGDVLTATATDFDGNTSEFSDPLAVALP